MYSMQGQTSYWLQHLGVSTGLPCGIQIANLFFQALDLTIASSFRSDIDLYKRYIDDILIVARNIRAEHLLGLLNQFDVQIRITHDAHDAENARYSSFLDLNIYLCGDQTISYSTYRKPKCTYSYLPFHSCPSSATKLAIVHTELNRLLPTNFLEADFDREVIFS